ncbi:uncharacterized protein BDW47DRAFT_106342 [Aspergillus candidus]|uniref:Secreted protein n=1 Tax=Aspergillus candidus TaxID=41067 RepID=A0A2I2FB07_ASPCN|nr:hypothetical protein BDW47DRAFT_106342 [Aspergillus candidus]PLB37784.1 hypothetical protein BDW47DRAFT_106342 [Aspergillus candidus]
MSILHLWCSFIAVVYSWFDFEPLRQCYAGHNGLGFKGQNLHYHPLAHARQECPWSMVLSNRFH